MKRINIKILVITCIVCLLPIMLGIYFYQDLPESVAIHWGIDNNPNGYFSKPAFVFGMPMIMLFLQVFCCIASDFSDKNPEANKKAVTVYKWIIPILSVTLYIITLMYALGNQLDIRKVVMIITGILFIVCGNYLPKVRGDYYLNMRFLKLKDREKDNEKLINKTVKICSYMLIVNGVFCMISALFPEWVSVLVVALVLIESIITYLYALLASRKK